MRRSSVDSSPHAPHLDQHIAYIEKMVNKGGPDPSDYASFQRWLREVAKEHRSGDLSEEDLAILREAFGDALSSETLQGFCLKKPHGYAGDFETIDQLYTQHVTDTSGCEKWDVFFQAREAARAVRNRKQYFIRLMEALEAAFPDRETLPVLNIASGPARDVFEFFDSNGHNQSVRFECVDNDPEAIDYAQQLCEPYLNRIQFVETNALRYQPETSFQVAWSAGLFDYLSDKGFQFLLEHMLAALRDDGELVIGNFSPRNPTRDYMEAMLDWHLHYRTEEKLIELAKGCGVPDEDIRVDAEPEGINLFLHVKRGDRFLDLHN